MLTTSESLRVLRAIWVTMADSERTDEIHVVEELTGRARFAAALQSEFDGEEARVLLRKRPELRSDQVDYEALLTLPRNTLGFAYADHLARNGLTADSQSTPTPFVEDPDLAYLVRRFRQTHDVWHALTGLGTSGHEEVIIHAFSWGQLRLPVSLLILIFGTLKHIVLEARWQVLRAGLWDAYASGRDARPLLPVYWERYWEEPVEQTRARLGIRAVAGHEA